APEGVLIPAGLRPGPRGHLHDRVLEVALVLEVHVVAEHLDVAELVERHVLHVIAASRRRRLALAPAERPPVERPAIRAEPHARRRGAEERVRAVREGRGSPDEARHQGGRDAGDREPAEPAGTRDHGSTSAATGRKEWGVAPGAPIATSSAPSWTPLAAATPD